MLNPIIDLRRRSIVSMTKRNECTSLVEILQLAYSGELAAGYAYRGHWHSVKDKDEAARIKLIENDRKLSLWPQPPAKANIRLSFAAESDPSEQGVEGLLVT